MTEKMAEQVPDTFPCIFCQHPINPADLDWKCPCCGHFNAHGSIFKVCEECRFSPSRFPCPGCNREFDFMVLLGNYGIYEVSKVPIYGLTDELLQAVPKLFAGVIFTFHHVVRSIHFYNIHKDERDRIWFHAWLFGTNPPNLEKAASEIGKISFVFQDGKVSLCYLQP